MSQFMQGNVEGCFPVIEKKLPLMLEFYGSTTPRFPEDDSHALTAKNLFPSNGLLMPPKETPKDRIGRDFFDVPITSEGSKSSVEGDKSL